MRAIKDFQKKQATFKRKQKLSDFFSINVQFSLKWSIWSQSLSIFFRKWPFLFRNKRFLAKNWSIFNQNLSNFVFFIFEKAETFEKTKLLQKIENDPLGQFLLLGVLQNNVIMHNLMQSTRITICSCFFGDLWMDEKFKQAKSIETNWSLRKKQHSTDRYC